jgi:hypothetical protein
MAQDSSPAFLAESCIVLRSKRRDLLEVTVAYGLILVVIWTPRPLQRSLWMVAAGAVAAILWKARHGPQPTGLRRQNFLRSMWVVGVALAVSGVAVAVAVKLDTLRLPEGPVSFIKTYWGYALWSFVQQFLMQCLFLSRMLRLLPAAKSAALATASIFALAHLPNPILTPMTLVWGLAACLLFLHYRNLYPLAIAHAILGITVAATIPGPLVHNMRVGLGYQTYGRPTPASPHLPPQP